MNVVVRTRSEPNAFVSSLRNTVLAIDPNQPITSVATMDEIMAGSIAQPRLSMLLMGLFGVLALLLAVVGIYGLLSYTVAQRTQEMGIRMALGARMTDVLSLVLKQGVVLILIGEAVGLRWRAGAYTVNANFAFRRDADGCADVCSGLRSADGRSTARMLSAGAPRDADRSVGSAQI